MKNRTLGTLALVGGPVLFFGLTYEKLSQVPAVGDTQLAGVYTFIYMASWMCSLFGLLRLEAAGSGLFGRGILWTNLFTLTLANILNLSQLFLPGENFNHIRVVLDPSWPLSHALMLVIGIAVIRANRLPGWKRYTPLIIGLWLPLGLAAKLLLTESDIIFYLMALYSAVAFSLLAVAIRTSPEIPRVELPAEKYQAA